MVADCCGVKAASAPAPAVSACPGCGQKAKQVPGLTIKSLVRCLPFRMAPGEYHFCETPSCDVVYFPSNPQAPIFYRADVLVRVGLKEDLDPIPVCYCFGVTRKEIWGEIERTGESTVAQRIKAEVQAGNCACEVKNPSGKCCLGQVTRAVQAGRKRLEAVAKAR